MPLLGYPEFGSNCFSKKRRSREALRKAGLEEYLFSCDRMVAFVSPEYFSRLWCVYELATFCRRYCSGPLRTYLDKDLVLISAQWSWMTNLCRGSRLSEEEIIAVRHFRCRDARTLRPSDRAILLSHIRRDWGSEEAFDAFVRSELPGILADGKLRYSKQASKLLGEHMDLAFGG